MSMTLQKSASYYWGVMHWARYRTDAESLEMIKNLCATEGHHPKVIERLKKIQGQQEQSA